MPENDNKWLDAVKDAVEGIENPLPEGMWESIASSIAAGRRRRRIIVSTAAAAAMAALAIILPQSGGTGSAGPVLAQEQVKPAPASDGTVPAPEDEVAIADLPKDATAAATSRAVPPTFGTPEPAQAPAAGTAAPISTSVTSVPASETATQSPAAISAPETATDSRTARDKQPAPARAGGQPEQRKPAVPQPEKQFADALAMADDTGRHDYAEILSAGLHISLANGNGTSSSSLPAVSSVSEDPESGTMMPTLPEGEPTGFRSEYVHNMPVNLGISLSIGLAPKLSLETGIVWSYHSARKDNWFNTYLLGSNIQRMHYAGIPLGLRYTPLEGRRTSLYLYGGVMAQKCVSASWNGSKLNNISPVILSSHLSAGFQYRIAGPMAFYLEPGVSHNSVTGDEGFTMYGQHPWQFDLKGGIRFNIK